MNHRRKAALLVVAVLALSLAMGSAGAYTFGVNPDGTGGFVGSVQTGPGARSISTFQAFKVVTGNNSSLTVYRNCTAVATPAPVATVVRCWLVHGTTTYADKTQAEPLNVSTINQVVNVPIQPYIACVQAYALYNDGTKFQGAASCH